MTMTQKLPTLRGALSVQLLWFIRCRWVAGFVIVAGALFDRWVLGVLPQSTAIYWVGIGVLVYNVLLYTALVRIPHPNRKQRVRPLQMLAWVQLLLDFASLTLLIIWTGGLYSPLARFYVLHMVFASLLLPRRMAYAGAGAAIAIQTTGLALAGQLPADPQAQILGITQAMVLFLVVFLTNHITRNLRRQRRRLVRQNRHIKRMSRRARRHQQAMIQHEKMVALGQMAAGVAHEIANPLASMDSLLQLLQRKPEKMGAQSITTLREQVARINQIIRQMKEFSHPDESLHPKPQTLPINGLVEQAIAMLQFDPRLKRVALDLHLSPDAGQIPVLPQALQQILLNLMINALDAMTDVAEPRLTVRTEYSATCCAIEISDNGHGIRTEHMRRLFEPFFTTKPLGKGTGLGLSISYTLVRKLGGDIAVRSQSGQGTTFTVRLPVPGVAPDCSQNWEPPAAPIVISGKNNA